MQFESGEILFYVDPFSFTIDLVKIDYLYSDYIGDFYIENTGAYLKEEDLFRTLQQAQKEAINRLGQFYQKKMFEIQNRTPIFEDLENGNDTSNFD